MMVLFRENPKKNNVFFIFMLPVVMAMVALMAKGIPSPSSVSTAVASVQTEQKPSINSDVVGAGVKK